MRKVESALLGHTFLWKQTRCIKLISAGEETKMLLGGLSGKGVLGLVKEGPLSSSGLWKGKGQPGKVWGEGEESIPVGGSRLGTEIPK